MTDTSTHARRRAPRTLGSSPFSGPVGGGFGGAFSGLWGRDAPGLADDGFHAVDDVALVAEVGGGFGGFDAARVFPAAVHGGAGQGGEPVEALVAAGHLGADGPVNGLGELAAVLLPQFALAHDVAPTSVP